MALEELNRWACFGGWQTVVAHESDNLGCRMEVAIFTPPAPAGTTLPVLYWLSGLTCTWENMVTKAGAQRWAAENGVVLICPDTSPRGDAVPDAPDEYDFGKGAGFYLDATQDPWAAHYRMETYVTEELPALLEPTLPIAPGTRGIFGHSMGGHGALTLALRHPDLYRTVSAFSPIVAPAQVPWGEKAFGRYLGDDRAAWAEHDATALVAARGWSGDILIDQGEADTFLDSQLRPQLFQAACEDAGVPLTLRLRPHYDHSYYFIQSFIGDHIAWHTERLLD